MIEPVPTKNIIPTASCSNIRIMEVYPFINFPTQIKEKTTKNCNLSIRGLLHIKSQAFQSLHLPGAELEYSLWFRKSSSFDQNMYLS